MTSNFFLSLPTEAVLTDSMGSICPIADVPVTEMKGDRAADGNAQSGRDQRDVGTYEAGTTKYRRNWQY